MAQQVKIAKEPQYGGTLVDSMAVQVKIKQIIVKDVMSGVPESKTKAKVKKLIDDFCREIKDKIYCERARITLSRSFVKWYRDTAVTFGALPFLLLAKFKNVPKQTLTKAQNAFERLPPSITQRLEDLTPRAEFGREWHDSKYRRAMKNAYARYVSRLADDEAKYSKYVSLRNLAEVEVRRAEIAQMIAGLRAQGVRLAWCSTHADCSKRCSKWQGKLFSLDRTSGVEDGIPYIPIEVAINDEEYGVNNGLFGYNCRHRLIPYVKGSKPPRDYSAAEMAKERAIDRRQRELEKIVRKWKIKGFVLKGVDSEASKKAFEKARAWNDVYERYSHANGRAYYRERVRVMTEEIEFAKINNS